LPWLSGDLSEGLGNGTLNERVEDSGVTRTCIRSWHDTSFHFCASSTKARRGVCGGFSKCLMGSSLWKMVETLSYVRFDRKWICKYLHNTNGGMRVSWSKPPEGCWSMGRLERRLIEEQDSKMHSKNGSSADRRETVVSHKPSSRNQVSILGPLSREYFKHITYIPMVQKLPVCTCQTG
jgi:hypothetical protein